MPRQLAVLPRGPSAHHRPGASAGCGGALLALLSGVLLCLQAAAQRVPGVSWAVAADLIHQQGSGRQLLRLSSGRDDLEPLAVESILDPADEKGGGVHANLIGSGSSFAAALHSDAMTAYSQHVYPALSRVVSQGGSEFKSLRMEYYPSTSPAGRCRFQNFDKECVPGDSEAPKKEEGPFAFAASDSPYTLEYHRKYPSHQVFPVAASAVVAVYNVPDESLGQLELSIDLPTLAKIFTGNITNWRHPDILSLNPAVADSLLDEDIHVVVHMEGSGTTAIFKTPLADHHPLFEEQRNNGTLESGGPAGWPAGEATFTYKRSSTDIGHAVLSKPYSIGYMGHYQASTFGLSIFSIIQECVQLSLDIEGVVDAVEAVGLPDDYHGVTGAEKATLNLERELLPSSSRTSDSLVWPFIGFTYIVIRQGDSGAEHEGDNTPSCRQMELMAEYMMWFYSADLVDKIAETYYFGTLAKPVRRLLMAKLEKMVCGGVRLVDEGLLYEFREDLHEDVDVTTTRDLEQLLVSYLVLFQTQEMSFRAVTRVENGADYTTRPLMDDEGFRLLSAPGKVDLPEAVSLPWIISALVVRANLPDGHESFLLDLEALGMILRKEITLWSDPKLVDLNPDFKDPSFSGERIVLLSPPDNNGLLNGILRLGRDEVNEGQPWAGVNIHATVAQLREKKFAMAALPGHEDVDFASLARIATESSPDGVEPSRESLKACLAEVGVGLINRAYRGCYPLVFSVNAFLHKKYDRRANNHGKMAALFWYNMLKNIPDVEDRRRPIIHVYQSDRTSSELKDEMRRKIFSIQYSDGTAILKKYRTSAHGTIVTASISVVIITLVLLLAVLVFLYRKMHRKLARIAVMATEAEIDTESPAIKVMKFLQGIANGNKIDKSQAQELLIMLRQTQNLQVPDINGQLQRMKQDGGSNSMSAGIGNYLVQMFNQDSNHDLSRSSGSQASLMVEEGLNLSSREQTNFSLSSIQDQSVLISINEILGRAHVPLTSPEDLLELVSNIGNAYFFNPMYLQAICGNRPLSTITMCLLHESGLIQGLRLDREKLVRYMLAVEDNYPSNPYHNAAHAAFVVHRTCVTLRKLGIGNDKRDMALMLSALIGAAVHDVLHPGVGNGYLVKVEAGVARDFNDQAVLENNSLRLALELLRQPDTSFLEGSRIKSACKQTFKSHLIKVVLGTDMSSHFDVISSFQQKVSLTSKEIAWGGLTVEQKGLVIQMSVKTADIGHCTARMKQHLYWSKCLEDEFFLQGDMERKADLEISPMMDREKPGVLWPKNQVGFFTVIVLPMLEAFAATFPAVEPLLLQARANVAYWKQVGLRFEIQPAAKYLADMMQQFNSRGATLCDEISDMDCDPAPQQDSIEELSGSLNLLRKPSNLKIHPVDASAGAEIEQLIELN